LDGVAIQSAAQHGVAHDAAQDHQDAVAHRDADAGVSQFALQCDDPPRRGSRWWSSTWT